MIMTLGDVGLRSGREKGRGLLEVDPYCAEGMAMMHPREREGLYDVVRRYIAGEQISHENMRIFVEKLFKSEQEVREELAELEQEYNDLFRRSGEKKMKIDVYENHDGSKLVAMLVEDDGTERELARSEVGNDDLLNKIDEMNLSHLTVKFHWSSSRGKK